MRLTELPNEYTCWDDAQVQAICRAAHEAVQATHGAQATEGTAHLLGYLNLATQAVLARALPPEMDNEDREVHIARTLRNLESTLRSSLLKRF
jgi:hypothetical protein